MTIADMMVSAVNYARQEEQNNQGFYQPSERAKRSFVALDVDLAKFADIIGWFHLQGKINVKTSDLLDAYSIVLKDFLVVANLNHNNQQIDLSDDELNSITKNKEDKDLSKVYLIIKKFLFNSYFNRESNDFVYAFKAYLKLGIVDLHLPWNDIQTNFKSQFEI